MQEKHSLDAGPVRDTGTGPPRGLPDEISSMDPRGRLRSDCVPEDVLSRSNPYAHF